MPLHRELSAPLQGTATEKYQKFQTEYPQCIYRSYNYSYIHGGVFITYTFEIPPLATFTPTWFIPLLPSAPKEVDQEVLDRLIFNLGMVELISYWKLTCAPTISLPCYALTQGQIAWWKKLYKLGLGEFFHLNQLDVQDFTITTLPVTSPPVVAKAKNPPSQTTLVPIGGGKDSAVSLELLKGKAPLCAYIINPRQATLDTVAQSGVTDLISAKRTLDSTMLVLNSLEFLNGHTPFSAMVAFSSVIAAHLHGMGYVALSNESSANEPTVLGSTVNHQYSKSFEFEQDFVQYERDFVGSEVSYFSLLRPYTELKIAQLFAAAPQYHKVFRSCNVGSKTDTWCGHCPKCLFVYIMLSPFVGREEATNIFGADLLDDRTLLEDFQKLIGLVEEKPFECVGSRDEVNGALQALLRTYSAEKPALLDYYATHYKGGAYPIENFLSFYDKENLVPPLFQT